MKYKHALALMISIFFITIFDFAHAQTEQEFSGYFNIGHGHMEQGESFYEFYLLDAQNPENPPYYLKFSDSLMSELPEFIGFSGNQVKITGTMDSPFYEVQDVPRFVGDSIVLEVSSIGLNSTGLEVMEYNFVDPEPTFVNFEISERNKEALDIAFKNTITTIAHNRANPTGPQIPSPLQSVAILLKFSDRTLEPHDTSYFTTLLYDQNQDSLNAYWNDASYGKLNLDGSVTEWVSLPKTRSQYFNNNIFMLNSAANDAVFVSDQYINYRGPDNILQNVNQNILWGSGPNGDDIDQIILIYNTALSAAWGWLDPVPLSTNEGITWVYQSIYGDAGNGFPVGKNYQKGYGVVAHEMGHNFGWFHTPLLLPFDVYQDPWSIMSGQNDGVAPPGPIAYHKHKADWITAADVTEITAGESKIIRLDRLSDESPDTDGYLMAKIPFGSQGKFYTVEARFDSQYDHTLHSNGIMIYQYNPNGYGSAVARINGLDELAPVSAIMVDMPTCTYTSTQVCVRGDFRDIDLDFGETFYDAQNNITIKYLTSQTDAIIVQISNGVTPTQNTPGTPLMLDAVPSSTEVSLTWNEPADNGGIPINEYKIERTDTATQTETFFTGNSDTFYDDAGLAADTEYTYKVYAINDNGESNIPAEITIKTTPTVQRAPTTVNNLQITQVTSSEIELRWDAPSDSGTSPIDSYKINKKATGATDWNVQKTANNQFRDTGLSENTNYVYQIIAVNQEGLESNPVEKIQKTADRGGSCLIATAAYGTELAPQVQFLREVRDSTVLSTVSGTAFMSGFNTIYYSFAPTIADMERESPMFQEAVRAFITPMISTLSIMSLAESGSEVEVLGLGISVIALNLGMYIAAPIVAIWKIKQKIEVTKNTLQVQRK